MQININVGFCLVLILFPVAICLLVSFHGCSYVPHLFLILLITLCISALSFLCSSEDTKDFFLWSGCWWTTDQHSPSAPLRRTSPASHPPHTTYTRAHRRQEAQASTRDKAWAYYHPKAWQKVWQSGRASNIFCPSGHGENPSPHSCRWRWATLDLWELLWALAARGF